MPPTASETNAGNTKASSPDAYPDIESSLSMYRYDRIKKQFVTQGQMIKDITWLWHTPKQYNAHYCAAVLKKDRAPCPRCMENRPVYFAAAYTFGNPKCVVYAVLCDRCWLDLSVQYKELSERIMTHYDLENERFTYANGNPIVVSGNTKQG